MNEIFKIVLDISIPVRYDWNVYYPVIYVLFNAISIPVRYDWNFATC